MGERLPCGCEYHGAHPYECEIEPLHDARGLLFGESAAPAVRRRGPPSLTLERDNARLRDAVRLLDEELTPLERENARLRAALERIVAWYGERGLWDPRDEPLSIASEALEPPVEGVPAQEEGE